MINSIKVGKKAPGRTPMWPPHHNFVVNVPMIMKFGTGVKLDVFYTMVSKKL